MSLILEEKPYFLVKVFSDMDVDTDCLLHFSGVDYV